MRVCTREKYVMCREKITRTLVHARTWLCACACGYVHIICTPGQRLHRAVHIEARAHLRPQRGISVSIYLKIQTLVSVYTLEHVRARVSSHAFIYVRMHQSEQISTLFCRSSYMLICVCNEATSARSYICSCISHFCVCACVCVSKCTKTSSVPHLPNHSIGDPPAL